MLNNKLTNHHDVIEHLQSLTAKEFLDFGADGLSYIKPAGIVNDKPIFALHSADGSHIATGQDIPTLRTIAQQHNMVPTNLQ